MTLTKSLRVTMGVAVIATLVSLALFLVVLVILWTLGGSPKHAAATKAPHAVVRVFATTTTTSATQLRRAVGAQAPTPGKESTEQSVVASRPAYQHLPYAGMGIVATVVGYDGTRIMVDVVSSESLAATKTTWQAFLTRWGDTGAAYKVNFVANAGAGR